MPTIATRTPILYLFSGLPGSGKSTLAQRVAQKTQAVYLRIDTIEQTLREIYSEEVQGEGYHLAGVVAADNLRLGLSVVSDCCNLLEFVRREWEQVALGAGATFRNIEVICSDPEEHRRRVETRTSSVAGLKLPTWSQVQGREYHPWTVPRIVIETAHRSEAECADQLFAELSR